MCQPFAMTVTLKELSPQVLNRISIHKIQIYLAYHWTHFMIERVLSFFFLMLTEQLKIYILPTMVLDTTPIGKELCTEKREYLKKGG